MNTWNIKTIIKKQPPGFLIAVGFLMVILIGAVFLLLPVSVRSGKEVTVVDALFTATSAVCVTGLIAVDTADHFTVFGRTVVAILIQVGGLSNLIPYQRNMLLNLTTSGLIIFGGLGFLVILDIWKKRSFQKLCLHSKAVITTSLFLLAAGTILLKTTEDISWLGAFFQSVSARTAGFSTYSIGEFTNAGLLTLAGADSSHVHWQAWCTDRYIHVVF